MQGVWEPEQSSGVLGMSLKILQVPNIVNVQATHERDLQHCKEGVKNVCNTSVEW